MSKDITQNEIINAIVLISENEHISEEVADFMESAAMAKLNGTEKHYGFYQLCPKCDGEKIIPGTHYDNGTVLVDRTCPLCEGKGKLVRPEIKPGPGDKI